MRWLCGLALVVGGLSADLSTVAFAKVEALD